MNNTMTLMLVVGAWIGFIWYVKSFSKKYKKTFASNNPPQKSDSNDLYFDPTCSYITTNIYHQDNDENFLSSK